MQRTRCVYFQDVTKPCNKRDPGSGCPARDGLHRDLAILGASERCVATHPSDLAVALAALDAVVHVHGPDGPAEIPLAELHRLPGDEPAARHRPRARRADHRRRAAAAAVRGALARTARSADRASFAFALVSVAAALDDRGRHGRATSGSRSAAWRTGRGARPRAEEALRGAPATAEAFRAAADAELAAARPLRDNGFKVPLMRNTIVADAHWSCARMTASTEQRHRGAGRPGRGRATR